VLNQTLSDFELWVLENGSDDNTVEIVKSIRDKRLKLFELGPVGVGGALQYAIENAPTEWLARMDADDLMFPNRLEEEMHFIRNNPGTILVGTAYALLTPSGHIIEPILHSPTREVTKERLATFKRFFADSSVIFNRYAALDVGGVDTDFKIDGVPLFFRLLSNGKCWEIAKFLQIYRLRGDSFSQEKGLSEDNRRVRVKYAPEFFEAQFFKKQQSYSFWQYVAQLELISGETKFVRCAANYMKQEGPYNAEANRMILRSCLGKPGCIYYRWRNRHAYRQRADWEQLFTPLLHSPKEGVVP
jgi:glycosyltransferase involved in cell wall biosynthesis